MHVELPKDWGVLLWNLAGLLDKKPEKDLEEGQIQIALQMLELILLDHKLFIKHLQVLHQEHETLCYVCPAFSHSMIRHRWADPDHSYDPLINKGMDCLSLREVAILLLDPLSLADVYEKIHAKLPECWLDRMGYWAEQWLNAELVA